MFGDAGNQFSWSSVFLCSGVIAFERIDAENCLNKESVPDMLSGSDEESLKQKMSPR
ncbi:hypothetical protein DPMN_058319 [Dreissena polymorpha]|uniref:Uncharacterized protein n=1 Tax=Dreissena polymorpha TaxID=45954 RepID=A0A9D4HDH2_DREPO|nr:hypothetical protein DPMN_058319 [Dreissena polymorpha]